MGEGVLEKRPTTKVHRPQDQEQRKPVENFFFNSDRSRCSALLGRYSQAYSLMGQRCPAQRRQEHCHRRFTTQRPACRRKSNKMLMPHPEQRRGVRLVEESRSEIGDHKLSRTDNFPIAMA